MTTQIHILNLGAGVQSTALYLMAMRRDEPGHVPFFDHAIFADTQEEPDEVYRHLEWLQSLGGPPILVKTFGKLGDDLVNGHHQVVRSASAKYRPGQTINQAFNIPAFIKQEDGSVGIVRRKCTSQYKISPIEQAIRRDVLGLAPGRPAPKDAGVVQYFGLSFDEPSRVIKAQDAARGRAWYTPRFPLFDLEMTRGDCVRYLREVAPDRHVPRSACTFCPYHDNAEWRRIRDTDPKAWARACEIDGAIREPGAACGNDLTGRQYLHRSCVPLADAPIDTPESRGEQYTFGFARECEGMCGL